MIFKKESLKSPISNHGHRNVLGALGVRSALHFHDDHVVHDVHHIRDVRDVLRGDWHLRIPDHVLRILCAVLRVDLGDVHHNRDDCCFHTHDHTPFCILGCNGVACVHHGVVCADGLRAVCGGDAGRVHSVRDLCDRARCVHDEQILRYHARGDRIDHDRDGRDHGHHSLRVQFLPIANLRILHFQ